MITEASVKVFRHIPKRDFEFSPLRYVDLVKSWRASCMFEVQIELDPSLQAVERGRIEYRQYIRGGVWIKRGNEKWTADDKPNGNAGYPIPAYYGEKCPGLPHGAVTTPGLSLRWKEDGQVNYKKPIGSQIEKYGYRDTATMEEEFEADIWKPEQSAGPTYLLRDTPSVGGAWGDGTSVTVWVELWFQGFVVEIEHDGGKSVPLRVLKRKSWECFFQDKKFT